jgi:hypothetical protein
MRQFENSPQCVAGRQAESLSTASPCSRGFDNIHWPYPDGRTGANHRAYWESADLPVEQHAGVGPTPGSASGLRDSWDSLGAFLAAAATWAADSPQNLPAAFKTRLESFRLWRVAGGQDVGRPTR